MPWRGPVFFFQAEDGIRDVAVTGVQTCALPISLCQPSDLGCQRLLDAARIDSLVDRDTDAIKIRMTGRYEKRRDLAGEVAFDQGSIQAGRLARPASGLARPEVDRPPPGENPRGGKENPQLRPGGRA